MELQDLLDELRVRRLDDNVQPYLNTDDDLTGYLNDAVRQACIRQRLLVESVNQTVCHYALASGERLLRLHPSVLAVRTLRATDSEGSKFTLEGKTVKWVRRFHPHFETWDNGRPHYWIPDYQQGYLYLDRGCDNALTIDITCWRTPLDDEKLDVADPTSTPIIDELWHLDLCDWATFRALSRPDLEVEDRSRASGAESAFDAKLGPLPSAAAVRLWGVSPVIGTAPQYL